jgi:hypothetical protein
MNDVVCFCLLIEECFLIRDELMHLGQCCTDWGPHVNVVGFCFLNLAADYKPPEELVKKEHHQSILALRAL